MSPLAQAQRLGCADRCASTGTLADAPGRRVTARPARPARLLALASGLIALSGCEPVADDIDAWMQAQRTQVRVTIQPLPAMQAFEPLPYARADLADPFHPSRLAPAPATPGRRDPALARELERPPQALEAYPLEQIAMIGSLMQPGRAEALVRADGRVHVVRPGDRVGQDRGRVLRIGERHIELREWVRDESGAWHERDNRIEMREAAR